MAKKKQQADVKIKKPKEKKSKIKPVKAYSEGYKKEKVDRFIAKVQKLQNTFALCRLVAGGVWLFMMTSYGGVEKMPESAQIILLAALTMLVVPSMMLIKATRKCPVCGNKIGKILGLFTPKCPYCKTNLDPERKVTVFK